jgi:putative hydrolase of HD superfamily
MIAWFLAKLEEADPYKVLLMALAHDLSEIRSNDHNWVHKKYVKIFEDEIREDQLKTLPFQELFDLSVEYEKRESLESKVAKDADMLDQILLLREYEWQGNREAEKWLRGINRSNELKEQQRRRERLYTDSAKKIFDELYDMCPSQWWRDFETNKNR